MTLWGGPLLQLGSPHGSPRWRKTCLQGHTLWACGESSSPDELWIAFGALLFSFWKYNVCSQPSFIPSYFPSSSPSWLCFSWYNSINMDGSVQMADYFYSSYPHWSPYQIQSVSHTLSSLFQCTFSLFALWTGWVFPNL